MNQLTIACKSIIFRLSGWESHTQDANGSGHHSGGAQALEPTKHVEADFIRHKGYDDGSNSNPRGAKDENEAFAIDVCEPPP